MSDLTDNSFYPFAEGTWLCIRFGKWSCNRLTEYADFGKKNHLFRWSSFWSWRICEQAKLSHLGHRKPTHIHWKADASKTSHCLVRILVHRNNWAIFLRKWARIGRYSQWRSLTGHVERIFVQKNWRGGYWQHLVLTNGDTCHAAETILDVLCPVF